MPQFSDDLFLGNGTTYMGTGNQAATSVFTGTISGTTLTVSTVQSGDPLFVGQYITGSSVTANSYITAVNSTSSGTTYTLSQSSTVSSPTSMIAAGNNTLGDPAPMSLGVGPLGRIYVWDTVPQTLQVANVAAAATYAAAGAVTLAAGTSSKSVTRTDGTSVIQLDVPRAVSSTTGTFTAPTFVTANIATAAAGAGGNAGSFVVSTTPLVGLAVGMTVTVTGTNSGTSGLAAGTYLVSATNGTTTFTLTTTAGAAITTTASGTNTGLTFAGTLTAVNVTVSGYDYYGQAMTSTFATSASSATSTNSLKAFYQVSSISVTAANGGNSTNGGQLSFGTSDTLGIPVRVFDAGYVVRVGWNNTLAANAGTFTAADLTNPATATTGDVRGTFLPASTATNGSRRLVMAIAVPGIAVGPNATRQGALGVTQA